MMEKNQEPSKAYAVSILKNIKQKPRSIHRKVFDTTCFGQDPLLDDDRYYYEPPLGVRRGSLVAAITSLYTALCRRPSKKKPIFLVDKPPMVNDMMDPIWLSYELPTSTIPEGKGCILPHTIEDNSAWAKTAVDFYLQERGQGCYADVCKLGIGGTHLFLERSWWGVLLGVEDNGNFDDMHIDAWTTRLLTLRYSGKLGEVKYIRWTIMPSSFSSLHLEEPSDFSYQLANGKSAIHAKWWSRAIDKVYIPLCAYGHWILVELQLPSFEAVVYDSCFGLIPERELKNIICTRWTNLLPKYLDSISYWEKSGNKKPKQFNVNMVMDLTMPQQAKIRRGDCGPFVCMLLERRTKGMRFNLPGDIDKGAFGLFYRHYMAREIYATRILPPEAQ